MKKMTTLLIGLLLLPSGALAKGPEPIGIYVNGRELLVEDVMPCYSLRPNVSSPAHGR